MLELGVFGAFASHSKWERWGLCFCPKPGVRDLILFLEVRCGGPTCVLLFTLPKVPDVSQGDGCDPFYPHTDAALAEGCKGLSHRYRATRHILLLKSTLFSVRRPHCLIHANIQQLPSSTTEAPLPWSRGSLWSCPAQSLSLIHLLRLR